jgi:hypothetical protein
MPVSAGEMGINPLGNFWTYVEFRAGNPWGTGTRALKHQDLPVIGCFCQALVFPTLGSAGVC